MTMGPKVGELGVVGTLAAGRWPRWRVADLAEHSLGKMLDKAKNRGEPRPYLRNLNVRWFDFDLSDLLEMRFLPSEVERYTVRKGDVVVCEGGYPGRAAIWPHDEPIFFQKALHRVRFHRPEHARWFLYYLHSKDLDGTLRQHFNGAGIQHFTGEALARFEVPVPPADEQQRIIAILDEAFAGIAAARANAERNLRNARALFESYVNALFADDNDGWVERTIGECFKIRSGDFLPAKSMVTAGEYDVYGGNGIAGRHNAYNLAGENVVIGRVGAKCGNVRHVSGEVWLTDNAFFVSKYFHAFDPAFLVRLLKQRQLRRTANQAAQPVISYSTIKDVPLRFPNEVAEQRTVVAKIEAFELATRRLEANCEKKLAALDELKQSLLHHAFTGQLTAGQPKLVPVSGPARLTPPIELHAGVIALARRLHVERGRERTFGRVKAEKVAHMVEAHVGVDLGRTPVKYAAGPYDYRQLNAVEAWASKVGVFDVTGSASTGYQIVERGGFDALVGQTRASLGDRRENVERLIELMVPMNTERAEVLATVYAAWNNMLLDHVPVTDEAIVHEARENWHPDKLKIPRERFLEVIAWMREHGVTPAGRGKRVGSAPWPARPD